MSLNNIRELYRLSNDEKALIEKKNYLYQVYKIYIDNYLGYYKSHVMKEYLELKRTFPDINFDIEVRVKSEYSYKEKVDRKLAQGYTGRIYDIFGSKIIVNSVNEQTDEDLLIDACYRIEEFINNKAISSMTIPNKSTDYIANPKDNGYQSIHLKRYIQIPNDPNGNFLTETQIKTFRMKEHEEYGPSSHRLSYKSRTPLLANIHDRGQAEYYLPHYFKFIHNTRSHYITISEKPFEERFRNFFNIDFNEYMENMEKINY